MGQVFEADADHSRSCQHGRDELDLGRTDGIGRPQLGKQPGGVAPEGLQPRQDGNLATVVGKDAHRDRARGRARARAKPHDAGHRDHVRRTVSSRTDHASSDGVRGEQARDQRRDHRSRDPRTCCAPAPLTSRPGTVRLLDQVDDVGGDGQAGRRRR